MRSVLALAALSGCQALFGVSPVDPKSDASADAKVYLDAPPAGTVCAGVTGAPLHICAQEVLLQGLTYSSDVDIDTDAGTLCTRIEPAAGEQGELCEVIATDLTIQPGATVSAHGSRPLVLVAMGTLSIGGTVDVSSHASPDRRGAGADDAACPIANGSVQAPGASTSGGGAGGSFGGRGGAGGAPAGGVALMAPAPIDPATLTLVRGGCHGGAGGTDHSMHTAPGGHSGGAVYLMAGTMLQLAGKVLANGSGGAGGASTTLTD